MTSDFDVEMAKEADPGGWWKPDPRPTDEERIEFKRGELRAAAAIMDGSAHGGPCLLHDTPEDREWLIAALHRRNDVGICWGDHLPMSIRRPNPKPTDCESDADALLTMLRGEIGVEAPSEDSE